MENFDENYLQHHGTKGQRWGVRRYQNKDGSLTPAGRKRYDKESEKLKAEAQKLKAEKKVLENKKKTQAKFDKLDEKKAKLEAEKKALKAEQKKLKKGEKETEEKPKETVEEKRARLLNSSDPNELYKNKDLLSTAEINERLNRIDTERKLATVAASTKTTGMEKVEKAVDTFRRVDKAYSTVADSYIGKKIKKKLGIEDEKKSKPINLEEFYNNIGKKTPEEIAKAAKVAVNMELIGKSVTAAKKKEQDQADAEQASKEQEKRMADAKKQVDDYNERWARGETDADTTYSKRGKDINDARYDMKEDRVERVTGEIVDDAEYDAARAGQRYVAGLLDTALNSEAARAGRLLLEEAIK